MGSLKGAVQHWPVSSANHLQNWKMWISVTTVLEILGSKNSLADWRTQTVHWRHSGKTFWFFSFPYCSVGSFVLFSLLDEICFSENDPHYNRQTNSVSNTLLKSYKVSDIHILRFVFLCWHTKLVRSIVWTNAQMKIKCLEYQKTTRSQTVSWKIWRTQTCLWLSICFKIMRTMRPWP